MKTDILQFDLSINGEIVLGDTYFDALNPSTGEVFAKIANGSMEHIKKAIEAAREAYDQGVWKDYSFSERGIFLKKIAKKIRDTRRTNP